jgi:hypothetical protein
MASMEGSDVRVATLEGGAACMGAFRQATSQRWWHSLWSYGWRGVWQWVLGVSVASATVTPRSRSGGLVLVMQPFPWVRFALVPRMTWAMLALALASSLTHAQTEVEGNKEV